MAQEIKHVFLRHIDNIESKNDDSYIVDVKALDKSIILTNIYNNYKNDTNLTSKTYINSGDNESLVFVVKYLNFYKDKDEVPPPEHPIPDNMTLIDIFETEVHIFGDLLNLVLIDKNIPLLKNIINICEELQINVLLMKLSAIACYYMQCLNSIINEDIVVKQLTQTVEIRN